MIGSCETPREDELAIFYPLRKQICYFFYDRLARLFTERRYGARTCAASRLVVNEVLQTLLYSVGALQWMLGSEHLAGITH